mgnify:CR=1 FL=1
MNELCMSIGISAARKAGCLDQETETQVMDRLVYSLQARVLVHPNKSESQFVDYKLLEWRMSLRLDREK